MAGLAADALSAEPPPAYSDVLVVGAGPTGLAIANLLGQAGIATLVVERNPTTTDEPKAVSIDEESLRLMQALGLYEEKQRILLPGSGTRYYGIRGVPLGMARGPTPPRFGHPIKSELDQTQFETVLFESTHRFNSVCVTFSTELVDLAPDAEGVTATLSDPQGRIQCVRATFVVGCDGGRSQVRKLMGIRMLGSSVGEPWVVLDTRNDPHAVRFAMHHGDPRRPHVIVPGRDGRCRYEFMLLPRESPETMLHLEALRGLVAPYRRLDPTDIVRSKVYTFHALNAEYWRVGRVLIAGDAAHMMPPFAGQGLNSGLRDAHNLAWKLGMVVRGVAPDGLLDTYQLERRTHADAMIQMSVRLGNIVMTRSRTRAIIRDALFRSVGTWGPVRRFISEMRYKPAPRYRQGLTIGGDASIAGTMLLQPEVLLQDGRTHLLDDALGPGWALLALAHGDADPFAPLVTPVWKRLDVRRVAVYDSERWPRPSETFTPVVDVQDRLARELWASGPRFVLVRPDRYIAGGFVAEDEERVAAAVTGQHGY